jgi:peptidylprolyl isomerase
MKTTLMLAAALAALSAAASAAPKPAPAKPAAAAAPTAPGPRDWRTPNPDDVLVIDTNKGRIIVEMVPEVAPNHVDRMRELAREHFFDGQTFFRVIDKFMDQTGDPQNTGLGGSSKPDIQAEFIFRRAADTPGWVPVSDQVTLEHGFIKSMGVASQSMSLAPMTSDGKVQAWGLYCPGTAGAARSDDPNSANSQFFLMRDRFPRLEKKYTAWGRVISGQDVVTAIKLGEPVPEPQDKMERVRLLSDLPEKERPKIRVIDPNGPWFKAQAAKLRAEKGTVADACDLPVPVEVK